MVYDLSYGYSDIRSYTICQDHAYLGKVGQLIEFAEIFLPVSNFRDPEGNRRRSDLQPPLTTLSDIYELPVKQPLARSPYSSLHDR